jgi:flagellar M-ring protein FliF
MPDLSRFRDIWGSLELRGQVTLVVSLLAVLGTAFFLYQFAAQPSYATLASGLDPAESAEFTSALEGAGIGYRLTGGGTGVSVDEGKLSEARVAISKQGLPRGGHVGFELFDKKSLGATDFQQKVDYQRALEGEIARTVEQIDGVQSAEVQLVLPEDTLFADEGAKASAAVLLSSAQLEPATVRGIAHLVSSSVKGLQAPSVTITDSTGQLLWPDADSAAGGLSASAKLRAEQLYAGQLTGQLNALLASTLGPGKAQARVHADLSLDQTSRERVIYGKKGIELQSQTEEETLGSKGATGSAPAGVSSNVPTYSGATTAGGGKSDYQHKTASKTYGVDKTIERTTVAPGAIKKLDVAVMVDESIPTGQVGALTSAISAAAGIDEKRGDTLSVSTVKFAQPVDPIAGGGGAPIVPFGIPRGLLKNMLIGLGMLVFLVVVRNGLRRREREGVAPEPTWLREFQSAVPLAQLESVPLPRPNDAMLEERTALRTELEHIARTEPETVAAQVKQWLKD